MTQTERDMTKSHRPGGVTVAMILLYVGGAAAILVGILILLAAGTPEVEAQGARTPVTIAAVIMILIGIVQIVLAAKVGRGSDQARKIVTALLVVAVANALFHYFTAGDGNLLYVGQHVVQLVLIVVLLWTGAAQRFFQNR